MDCPRCGGPLTQYQFGDAETVACDDCIYVGVSVDHTAEKSRRESWSEALDRFYRDHSAQQVEAVLDHEDVPLSESVLPVFESAAEAGSGEDDETTPAESDGDTSESATAETRN